MYCIFNGFYMFLLHAKVVGFYSNLLPCNIANLPCKTFGTCLKPSLLIMVLCENRAMYIFIFLIFVVCIYFYCFIAMVRTSRMTLKYNKENGNCLIVHYIGGNIHPSLLSVTLIFHF